MKPFIYPSQTWPRWLSCYVYLSLSLARSLAISLSFSRLIYFPDIRLTRETRLRLSDIIALHSPEARHLHLLHHVVRVPVLSHCQTQSSQNCYLLYLADISLANPMKSLLFSKCCNRLQSGLVSRFWRPQWFMNKLFRTRNLYPPMNIS